MMLVSLVIPMYNEERIIKATINSVKEYMDGAFEDYEVIFVNDCSTDGSLALAEPLATEKIKILHLDKNGGKGRAIRLGILAAKGDVIFFTDCDLAYGLDVIGRGLEYFENNPDCDVLIGSRTLHPEGREGYTLIRKLASVVYLALLKTYGGLKTSDSQSSLKAFRSEAAFKIFSLCEENGFSFDFEVLLIAQKLKLKIMEMPVKIINHADSSVNLARDSVKMFKKVFEIKKSVNKRLP